ncbi:hypothetical protein LAC81_34245 [Ensifer adhaerens]|nr:hypothetical protein LAC78_29585 [Ensifer adhaerens]UAY03044.1 hypothetical protein LAC80_30720 [Ensifer adhaerens]UAY11029.1 hypothetical protein LAC81_34245 [Ensifer adhaerens]
MNRTLPLLCMAVILSACASMNYSLPKCDGYSRRPLNRTIWQWEDNKGIKQEHAADAQHVISSRLVAAHANEGKEPPAFAQYGSSASYRPCEG